MRLEADYLRDQLDGEEKVFESDGQLVQKSHWKEGKLHGLRINYSLNGTILESFVYKTGFRNGPARIFGADGKLRREMSYRQDRLFGPRKDFYLNGRVMRECLYREGKVKDSCHYWTEKGKEEFNTAKQRDIDSRLGQ
jgi:hypothetical protein